MRYILIILRNVSYEEEFGPEAVPDGFLPDDTSSQEVSKVIGCNTPQEVAEVIKKNIDSWSLWEVTSSGILSRAITFKSKDDVEIS